MAELIDQLTQLFERLRQAGLPLGVEQYLLLIRALRLGIGLEDKAALKKLCQLLWLTAPTDQPLFDRYFDNIIKVNLPVPRLTGQQAELEPKPDLAPQPATKQPPSQIEEKPVAEAQPSTPKPEITPAQPPVSHKPPEPQLEAQEAVDLIQRSEDVVATAQTVLHLTSHDQEIFSQHYLLQADYLPVSRRQMKQSWRHLRRMVRSGPPVELDVPATIRQIGRYGFLIGPVLRPRRVNQAALLLLLDQNGSMTPFHSLGRSLAETVTASGCFGQIGVYYFHNYPPRQRSATPASSSDPYREHNLYQKPQCVEARPVNAIMAEFKHTHPDTLIFSDAGAARGGWNEERIQATALFLYQLRALGVEQFAWLNPLPKERWSDTSAEAIAGFVPMFTIDYSGLRSAIHVLRSHSRHTLAF